MNRTIRELPTQILVYLYRALRALDLAPRLRVAINAELGMRRQAIRAATREARRRAEVEACRSFHPWPSEGGAA
jgi:hypothetical protein